MKTYIHYGSDHFDPSCFIPIRNCREKPKPADGTGLWASREGTKIHHGNEYAGSVFEEGGVIYGWKEWCEDNRYKTDLLKISFKFQLPDTANIILLSDPVDLLPLPKLVPWKLKNYGSILDFSKRMKPTLGQIQEFCRPNHCILDYEKILTCTVLVLLIYSMASNC